jgi:hypothetical protein
MLETDWGVVGRIALLFVALMLIPTVLFPLVGVVDDYFAKKAAELRAARKR